MSKSFTSGKNGLYFQNPAALGQTKERTSAQTLTLFHVKQRYYKYEHCCGFLRTIKSMCFINEAPGAARGRC